MLPKKATAKWFCSYVSQYLAMIPDETRFTIVTQLLNTIWEEHCARILARPTSPKGGRPALDQKRVLEAAIWVCLSRCSWSDLPSGFPNGKSVHRTFRQWQRNGQWDAILWALATKTPSGQVLNLYRLFRRGERISRGLSLTEVWSMIDKPALRRDRHALWLMLLFLSPNGTDRRQLRTKRKGGTKGRQ